MQYKVQSGDTLSKIADFIYGDSARWSEIARANNLGTPYTIEVGQIINVPEIVALTSPVSVKTSAPSNFSMTAKTPFGLPPTFFGIPTNYILIGAAFLLLLPIIKGKD